MRKIQLKKLSLRNFKGIKSLEINFDKDVTNIYGDNATGKTTVFDSFTWLLFGKDHNDNTKFEIKTLDRNNNAIPKLVHEVEAVLNVGGAEHQIKRSYSEKWVKQRGSAEAVLQGHETAYFYNEVPVTLSEYNQKISEIIEEQTFKLLTHPFYFNSLAWTKRRTLLETIANVATDQQIAEENPEFAKLFIEMADKSLEDFKRIINAKKKKVKEQLDEIPTRIDEAYRSIPESEPFDEIRKSIEANNKRIKDLTEQIADNSKVDVEKSQLLQKAQASINEFQFEVNNLFTKAEQVNYQKKSEHNSLLNSKKQEIQSAEFEVAKYEKQSENEVASRREFETKIAKLRLDFDNRQAETFKMAQDEICCPTCKRQFEPWQIDTIEDELIINFNTAKASDLAHINATGKNLKESLEKISKSNEITKEKLEKAKLVVQTLKDELIFLESTVVLTTEEYLEPSYYAKKAELENAKVEFEKLKNAEIPHDNELIIRLERDRGFVIEENQDLNRKLFKEEQIKAGKERIQKLEDEAKIYGQELADLEAKEFIIERFNTEKMNRIEESVNSMFPTVRFKLFSYQLNGGVAECCDTLIKGVPFDNANNASRIQAGIEIINVLSEYYEFSAPIFVDNAESIIKIPETSSQLIKLVVSDKPEHKVLTVN